MYHVSKKIQYDPLYLQLVGDGAGLDGLSMLRGHGH